MTIKEISVEKRVQISSQKKKDLNQTVFFNAVSQSDQYYKSNVLRVIESPDYLYLKTVKKTSHIMTNCIGLPRPFY
ncbi:hypothetical protein SAMN05444388_11459 [Flavobacterium johnsoniae]|jgi:hypothetical protein|uniref:Uncharacterized protein n=1 Tax=Flavobacterium johnsoniae TaxID=986 RepID=A0A1M5UMX8_FLAJO|nr:hypothetical protein SAMN05444388_11459 [Flavobacterium johnsoniae]